MRILGGMLALGVFLTGPSAKAETAVDLHGFLTSATVFSDQQQPYANSVSKKPNFVYDSKLGLNIRAEMDGNIDLASQIVAINSELTADWYFLTLNPIEAVRLRAGKLRLNTFLYTETKDIGKTYPWVRPPIEVYSVNPLQSLHGGSAAYQLFLGSVDLVIEGFGGRFQEEETPRINIFSDGGSAIESDAIYGGSLELMHQNNMFRTAYLQTRGRVTSSQINEVVEIDISFFDIAMRAELGELLVVGEYMQIETKFDDDDVEAAKEAYASAAAANEAAQTSESAIAVQRAAAMLAIFNGTFLTVDSWYGTLGYQVESFLPHLTYARLDAADENLYLGSQSSWTTGIKWDFSLAADVKVEWSHVSIADDSSGLYFLDTTNAEREFQDLNIYSASFDVVF